MNNPFQRWVSCFFTKEDLPNENDSISIEMIRGILNRYNAVHPERHIDLRTDFVTNLPNEYSFREFISQKVAETQRCNTGSCVASISFSCSDDVLEEYAYSFSKFITAHTRTGDYLARLNNGTFGILMNGVDLEKGALGCKRIIDTVNSRWNQLKPSFEMEVVGGVTEILYQDSTDDILDRVKQALATSLASNEQFIHVDDGNKVLPVAKLLEIASSRINKEIP